MYYIFVDFSKAFDGVKHEYLWHRLISYGLHGRVLRVLRSMYNNCKSCVLCDEGITNYFDCSIGTRQGCLLSPLLFTLFINELSVYMCKTVRDNLFITENVPSAGLLMYADDVNDSADIPIALQRKLNQLEMFCKQWSMTVNLDKTNIIVFRNGGIVKRCEKWFYMGKEVKCTKHYNFLGLLISSRLSWSPAKNELATKGKKAMTQLQIVIQKLGGMSPQHAFKLFDSCVTPVLIYGSEIWGYEYSPGIERVHLLFCRYMLGVGSSTNNEAVLGECGRMPLCCYYIKKCVSYWVKILGMSHSRYPRASYEMLKKLDEAGKVTWATKIKLLLMRYGFGHVWIEQQVGNPIAFLTIFQQRLKDCYIQEWHASINESPRLRFYCNFKLRFEQELYLQSVEVFRFRKMLAKFRCSNHPLAIETGRHRNDPINSRVCLICGKRGEVVVEDETHFLLFCPAYQVLRLALLPKTFTDYPSREKAIILISSKNPRTLSQLAIYVFKAFSEREKIMQSL